MHLHLIFLILDQHLFHVNELSQQLRQALRPIDRLFCFANIEMCGRWFASVLNVVFVLKLNVVFVLKRWHAIHLLLKTVLQAQSQRRCATENVLLIPFQFKLYSRFNFMTDTTRPYS